MGFLLDDFVHLGYISDASHGDLTGFLKTFTGNWSGQTDGLTSFRPGISASFLVDHMVYGLNPVGYHFTNLLVFSFCALLCGVLTFQLLSGEDKRRRFCAALLGALLFIAYPLHAETTAWIVGRVDLFCTVFYLAAVSFYIRFRKAEQYKFLSLSLLSFFLALISKEMAVSLPFVIVFAEILLSSPLAWQKLTLRRRVFVVSSFALMLAGFAALRTVLLGSLIGGYGAGGFREILHSRYKFFDLASLKRIFFGINTELKVSPLYGTIASVSWLTLLALFLIRLPLQKPHARVLLFTALWTVVSVLPAFQVWEISSNLVGSRLFFLGSASFCIFLSAAMLPLIFRLADKGKTSFTQWRNRFESVLACFALASLLFTWGAALQFNLKPWIEAGKQMSILTTRLFELVDDPRIDSLVLFGLPQDFEGASMVGNEDILRRMLRPPVTKQDYSKKISIYKSPSEIAADKIDSHALKQFFYGKKSAHWLLWSKDEKRWLDWTPPGGATSFSSRNFSMVTKNGLTACSTIENPRKGRVVWTKLKEPLDPFAVTAIELRADVSDKDIDFCKKVSLIWRSANQPQSSIDYSQRVPGRWIFEGGKSGRAISSMNRIGFQPGFFRDWILNGPVAEIGFILPPGGYSVKLHEVKAISADLLDKEDF